MVLLLDGILTVRKPCENWILNKMSDMKYTLNAVIDLDVNILTKEFDAIYSVYLINLYKVVN